MSQHATTRLAPSPTGALHLGNARTFLVNWALARQRGWRVLLRIDDLEGPRVKPGAAQQAIDDLRWLGLDWDAPPIRQSARSQDYAAALVPLLDQKVAYACVCTRREIEAAAAGKTEPDEAVLYPGTCRSRFGSLDEAQRVTGRPVALRFLVPQRPIAFVDERLGRQVFMGQKQIGDFVIRKADGEWGYHLANVIDDVAFGVTHVVRGEDLLASAPRQILIYESLRLSNCVPNYIHLPLIVGPDGRKLAKRHGDTRLSSLRESGVTAGQVRALLAKWSGFSSDALEMTLDDWLRGFDLSSMPQAHTVYDEAHDRPQPPKSRGVA